MQHCHDLGMVLANPTSNEDWVAMWFAWIKFTEEQIPDRTGFTVFRIENKKKNSNVHFIETFNRDIKYGQAWLGLNDRDENGVFRNMYGDIQEKAWWQGNLQPHTVTESQYYPSNNGDCVSVGFYYGSTGIGNRIQNGWQGLTNQDCDKTESTGWTNKAAAQITQAFFCEARKGLLTKNQPTRKKNF